MRTAIEVFAMAMEQKLCENDAEKGKEGWLHAECNIDHLMDKLENSLEGVRGELDWYNIEETLANCLDTANYAMMIYDRILHEADSAGLNKKKKKKVKDVKTIIEPSMYFNGVWVSDS